MKEQHLLVDYENVQPSIEDLLKLAPKLTDVWLFHGPNQIKRAENLKAAHDRVTLVPHSGKGKNALDFHLSFYLGYVAARHPDANLLVVANDKGYDSMLSHAKLLGFTVKRVGHKATATPVAKVAQPVLKKLTPAAKAAPAKAAKPAKKTPAKVPTAKQPAEKPVATKKAAVKQPAAKKIPAKKASVKKLVVPKAPKAVTPAKVVVAPDTKEFSRIKAGLIKMGNKAPHKLTSFLRHIGAQLGKNSTAEQIDAVVEKLERAKVVHIAGDLILYS
jgi:hypothetical protein